MAATSIFLLLSTALIGGVIAAWIYAAKRRKRAEAQQCHNISPAPCTFDYEAEVVVVGAGIVGSAMAATLARDGRRVTAVERDLSEPNRIVGELLQPGGLRALRKLGLQDAVEGIDSHVVYGYVVHDNDSKNSVPLTYPEEEGKVITGRSFHHGRFVMGLRKEARKAKVNLVEGTVTSLLEDKRGHIVGILYKERETGSLKSIKADLTVIADGCFSKFRKGLTTASVSVTSHFAGIIMHDCPQFKLGHAEVVLPLGGLGPMLIYQISSTCTRILVDLGKIPSNIKQCMRDTIAPQVPEHIREPFLAAVEKDNIRTMPNSFLPSAPIARPGMILLGDAMNMRHPLTGAGMSVALNDALIWRSLLSSVPDLQDHSTIEKCSRKFQWQRKFSHAFVINVMAEALHAVFSAPDEHLHHMRKACFEYFRLGGRAKSGPVGLLSVITPHPHILIGHFFAVAFYSIYRVLSSCGYRLHWGLYTSVMVLKRACYLIVPLIASEIWSLLPY